MNRLFPAAILLVIATSAPAQDMVSYETDQSFDDVIFGLENAILDEGLVIEGTSHERDLRSVHWCDDEMVVVVGPSHTLATAAPKSAESLHAMLREADWIVREPGSGTREIIEARLVPALGALRFALELGNAEAIKRAVEADLGIGCLSEVVLADAFRRGSLVPLPTPELDLKRQFTFIWHRHKYLTTGVREFLRLCREMTAGAKRSDDIPLPPIP